MGVRMIATGVLAAIGTLAVTILSGFLISVFIRSRSQKQRLRLGIPVQIIGPWLVCLYLLFVFVIWKLIGTTK